MSMQAMNHATYSTHMRVRVTERLLIAGLRAQERADQSEAARDRLAFLLKASQRLAHSLEPATLLEAMLDLLVPELADAASLHVLPTGRGRAKTTATSSERVADQPPEWWSWVDSVTRAAVTRAISLGVAESGLASAPSNADVDVDQVSFIVVPVHASGQALGALTLLSVAARRRYGPDDRGLIETFAAQAGLALENAAAFQEQRALVAHLEKVHRQIDATEDRSLRDDERRRIARDLHDFVEQTFFAIALTAAAAIDSREQSSKVPDLSDALRRIGELSTAGAEQLRSAIFALKQGETLPYGLIATLRSLAQSFEQRTGVDTDLVVSGPATEISSELSEAVHAIACEALSNVERHARASSVVLTLHFRPRTILFVVQDDGAGSRGRVLEQRGASTKHFGLGGLRERVRALHGVFHAGPNPNGGFTLRARIPLAMEGRT